METPLSNLRGAAQGDSATLGLMVIPVHRLHGQLSHAPCNLTLYLPASHRHGLPLFSSLLIFSRFSTSTSFLFFKSSVPSLGAIQVRTGLLQGYPRTSVWSVALLGCVTLISCGSGLLFRTFHVDFWICTGSLASTHRGRLPGLRSLLSALDP